MRADDASDPLGDAFVLSTVFDSGDVVAQLMGQALGPLALAVRANDDLDSCGNVKTHGRRREFGWFD